jgi:tetratricopeptide (TPR) repeat protein
MKKKQQALQPTQSITRIRQLSKRKQFVFTILMICSPLVILGIVEIILRFAQYQSDVNSLVVIKRYQGREYYSINPNIGRNYFASRNVAVPEPYEEVFEVNKSSRTFRIFCLGESTMYGYPYPSNVTAPRFLKDRLVTLFPDRNIEVINLGIPAISSSVVLELVKQVVNYNPNLIIVYSGHNEFYGTYGVASTEYVGYNKNLLDFYLQLRKLKTVALLREGVNRLRSLFYRNEQQTRKATFLERMVQDRFIIYGSPKYNRAKQLFQRNLNEMADIASKNNIPICFTTLVSNWKDQYPFISLFSSGIDNARREQWEKNFQDGIMLETQGQYDRALVIFQRALDIDSMRADLHYHMGKCYYSSGNFDKACESYLMAKDLDVLRFRATDEFNEIIRVMNTSKGTWVVDMDKAFKEMSPHGILGSELVTEHLHPNVTGYFLMGKAFCRSIAEHNQIKPCTQWEWIRDKKDREYYRIAAYTDLDIESANIRIKILTSAWPFQEETVNFTYTPTTPIQKIAFGYCQREYDWQEAHYRMARYYQQQAQYDSAIKEYKSVAKELYLFYHPQMLIGDMEVIRGKLKEAKEAYLHAFDLDPNQFVHMRLGTLFFQDGKVDEAIQYLNKAIAIDRDAYVKFTQAVKVRTLMTLGMAYYSKKQRTLAIDVFQQVLTIEPNNRSALTLLRQLETMY